MLIPAPHIVNFLVNTVKSQLGASPEKKSPRNSASLHSSRCRMFYHVHCRQPTNPTNIHQPQNNPSAYRRRPYVATMFSTILRFWIMATSPRIKYHHQNRIPSDLQLEETPFGTADEIHSCSYSSATKGQRAQDDHATPVFQPSRSRTDVVYNA